MLGLRFLVPLALSLAPAVTAAEPAAAGGEPVRVFDLCDNGTFELPFWEPAEARLGTGIPWWRRRAGRPRLEGGQLVTPPGAVVSQPFATFAPLVRGDEPLRIRARVAGEGQLVVRDGAGREARFDVGSGGTELAPVQIEASELVTPEGDELGAGWFELELAGGPAGASWDDLEVLVPLPAPAEAALAAELCDEIGTIIERIEQRGLDRVGPRSTTFVVQPFDVVTGESLGNAALGSAGVGVFYESLLELYGLTQGPEPGVVDPDLGAHVEELLVAHTHEYLELSFHPRTHLPRLLDPLTDEPLDDKPIEAARFLASLLDLAEGGPAEIREPALETARTFGEAVLKGGVLPSGEIASRYRASTGVGDARVPSIRKLDMPAELVRLGALVGDERYAAAALEALSEFEFVHMWSGSWDAIDPGLDDFYGHFGRRSVTMATADPDQPIFGHLATEGLDFFGPLWARTLAHGAFIAADEVRGWRGFLGVARLLPGRAPEVAELLDGAVRAHFKGELDKGGRWVDVSHNLWEPRFGLEVGDVPGVPVNLLDGLVVASAPELGLDRAFLRSLYVAVLRTSLAEYGRPFGLLATRVEARGANPSGSDLRMLPVLVGMLGRLAPEAR